jgi:hypothetical protein
MTGQQDPRGGHPPVTRAARGKFWRHWWWAVLCGSVALAGIAVAVIQGTGGSPVTSGLKDLGSAHSGGARPTDSAAASPAVTPVPAESTPIRARSASAVSAHPADAAPVPPAAKASLRNWAGGRGGAALALVSRQLGVSAQAGGVSLYLVMRQACIRLSAAVTAAGTGPPIPDVVMQRRYARALAQLATAAGHCQAGISIRPNGGESSTTSVNQAMIGRARSEFAAGARKLYLVTSQIGLPSLG